MSESSVLRPSIPAGRRQRGIRWWPLVVVTAANYLWQIPYAVGQYGRRWDALVGLSIPLILTGVWFAVAVTAAVLQGFAGRSEVRASVGRRRSSSRRSPWPRS